MALPANCSVALLAVKPVYADAIVEGRKRVEFRKTRFRRRVTHVAIYASTPVKRIIAIVRITACEEAPPQHLWRRHHAIGAISSDAFNAYYADVDAGIALHIDEVYALPEPVPLSTIRVRAPQSFCYLDTTETQRLRKAILS
jgi:predicted transcriptional regulator